MFTAFVTKILTALLAKAASTAGLKLITTGFSIYSWFETLRSVHECTDVPRCIVEVGYDVLVDNAVDVLVDEVVGNRFEVSRTESGLYVASHAPILQPTIIYPPPEIWERNGFSEDFATHWAESSTRFQEGLMRRRTAYLESLERARGTRTE